MVGTFLETPRRTEEGDACRRSGNVAERCRVAVHIGSRNLLARGHHSLEIVTLVFHESSLVQLDWPSLQSNPTTSVSTGPNGILSQSDLRRNRMPTTQSHHPDWYYPSDDTGHDWSVLR